MAAGKNKLAVMYLFISVSRNLFATKYQKSNILDGTKLFGSKFFEHCNLIN